MSASYKKAARACLKESRGGFFTVCAGLSTSPRLENRERFFYSLDFVEFFRSLPFFTPLVNLTFSASMPLRWSTVFILSFPTKSCQSLAGVLSACGTNRGEHGIGVNSKREQMVGHSLPCRQPLVLTLAQLLVVSGQLFNRPLQSVKFSLCSNEAPTFSLCRIVSMLNVGLCRKGWSSETGSFLHFRPDQWCLR